MAGPIGGSSAWGGFICTAHKTNGDKCKAPAMRGSRVCQAHGGMAGHVRAAAQAKIERLVDPAISTLRTMMLRGESHSIRLKAAESILDRAGITAPEKVEVDNQVSITVSYEDVLLAAAYVKATEAEPTISYQAELPPGNGHQKTAPEGGLDDGDGF